MDSSNWLSKAGVHGRDARATLFLKKEGKRMKRYLGFTVSGLVLIIALVLGWPLPSTSGQGALPAYKDPSLPIEKRVDDLVSRMTLEEKVSQMMNAAPKVER